VPLSEDEQRILTEIEQQLYATDPQLAHQVASATPYSQPARTVRWAAVGIVVSMGLILVLLQVNFLLAFVVGFGAMVLCGNYLVGALRQIGRVSIQQVSESMRAAGLRDFLSGASDGFRTRRRTDRDSDDDADA